MIDCIHWSRERDRGRGKCAIGRFGARPWPGECVACINAGANRMGLGDLVAKAFTPIARALKLPCIDPATNDLRPESGCAQRKAMLNTL